MVIKSVQSKKEGDFFPIMPYRAPVTNVSLTDG